MPLPTVYTEESLAAFMHASLSTTADVLGWSVAAGNYDEIVNDTLLALDADDLSALTGRENLLKVRAFARRALWSAVVAATAGEIDFKADGGEYDRAAIHEHALANLATAERDCVPYDDSFSVQVGSFYHSQDPYTYRREENA